MKPLEPMISTPSREAIQSIIDLCAARGIYVSGLNVAYTIDEAWYKRYGKTIIHMRARIHGSNAPYLLFWDMSNLNAPGGYGGPGGGVLMNSPAQFIAYCRNVLARRVQT